MKKIYKRILLIPYVVILSAFCGCGRQESTASPLPDFIIGCDVSSIISEEESGVIYYDADKTQKDLLSILKENGVNTIRIRLFNNPYNEDNKGYGGGNNDIDKAIEIGRRATRLGMGVMIDFHYSDFYADPSKQTVPKEWAGLSFDRLKTELYNYTYSVLSAIHDEGVNITMVQIGNETVNAMCGITGFDNVCELLCEGCNAARKFASDNNTVIYNVLHFTNPEQDGLFEYISDKLYSHNTDYDIFATSYYPYWHGSLDNLNEVLTSVSTKYGKKVLIAETSYPYTDNDSDDYGNVISSHTQGVTLNYDLSVSGQKECILDTADTIMNIPGGYGIIYWEPAWIAVPGSSYYERLCLWEEFGSGWASSYSAEYDADGQFFGGSSWDNQALFDKDGYALDSLSVFGIIAHKLKDKS